MSPSHRSSRLTTVSCQCVVITVSTSACLRGGCGGLEQVGQELLTSGAGMSGDVGGGDAGLRQRLEQLPQPLNGVVGTGRPPVDPLAEHGAVAGSLGNGEIGYGPAPLASALGIRRQVGRQQPGEVVA